MIRIFLSMALLSLFTDLSAQVLLTEDFNAMNIGNVGTTVTSPVAGQNGWYTHNSATGTNGGNSNFLIFNSNNGTNALQLTGPDGALGGRDMYKPQLEALWDARTVGNNILEVEFDFNPSVASASMNQFTVHVMHNAPGSNIMLAGIAIATNTTVNAVSYTNVVTGQAFWNGPTGMYAYHFPLGPDANTPLTISDNGWVRFGFSFNKTNGEIKWKGPGFSRTFNGEAGYPAYTYGIDPEEIDFAVYSGTGNTAADVAFFDNLNIKATNTDTLLTQDLISHSNPIAIFPNPAKGMVNIAALDTTIKNVVMTDINGRIVRNINNDSGEAQINVSDLAPGVYVLKVTSSEGNVATKKLVKE